jgi:hypothetical protein
MPCPQVTIPKIGLHLVKVRISTGFQTGTGPKDTRTTQRRLALKRSLAALNRKRCFAATFRMMC